MSGNDASTRADERLTAALEEAGVADPRPRCRALLRGLRERSEEAYERGISYYTGTLLPAVADDGAEPLGAWREYGLRLAAGDAPGRVVSIGPSGRSAPLEEPLEPRALVIHLPDDIRKPAFVVQAPREPTPAQSATIGVLAEGWRALP